MGLAYSVPDLGYPAVFSVYIRLKLNKTPIFQKMVQEGKGSKAPLTESFFHYPNNKYVLLALLGATAGQGVVWYTGQFYALFFLVITLRVDYITADELIGLSLIIGTPFFIVFGWGSDRIGRLKIILAGCAIAAITYFPLFQGLTHYTNPDLEAFAAKNPIRSRPIRRPATCTSSSARGRSSATAIAPQDFLTKSGLSFKPSTHPERSRPISTLRGPRLRPDATTWQAALTAKNFPKSADRPRSIGS